ncbi:MAG: CheR family methyltransferase [Chloroflexales bacterium]
MTKFFRDPVACATLANTVIPSLLRSNDGKTPLRVWVPGCASGEEAYSIAILCHEQLTALTKPPPLQLFATDIDAPNLAVACQGRYPAHIAAQVTPERLARYFEQDDQGYQVSKALREQCFFSSHNLTSDPPFGRMDLIVCRNLRIACDADRQHHLMPVLHDALVPGGFLFLGSAACATGGTGVPERFRVVDASQHIYQRAEQPQVNLPWLDAGQAETQLVHVPKQPTALGTLDLGAALARILFKDYTPTVAIIDPQGHIAYLSGPTHPYLSMPVGAAPTLDILALAHPDLRLPLHAALRATVQAHTTVVCEDLTITTANGRQRLTLTVRPLGEPATDTGLFVVILQTDDRRAAGGHPANPPVGLTPPVAALAQELQHTRKTLEATISKLQATNLDLLEANDELHLLNEELQIANEELQTSKEEIQSINEELQTVNAELSGKLEELDCVNADLANLFANTQIPMIFLHGDGQIARYTPQATDLFALIASDIGRPITDLTAHFGDEDLRPLIAQVLQTHTPAELIVHQAEHDRWWSVHLQPYRTLANIISGIVITFADITTLKRAKTILQEAHTELEQRVAARTQDLALANAALQAQIVERTRGEQIRQQLLQQLVTAQEEERRHIARELHDQMGQDLTALILSLKALQDRLVHDSNTAERIRQIQAMAVHIGEEVRSLAVQLRPSALDDLGLGSALNTYSEQWSARTHVAADLHTSGLERARLPLTVEITIYRLVQEALTNVLKHAQATQVSVIVEQQAHEVRVIVEDNGVGFVTPLAWNDLASARQLGLIGMQERIALLGGALTIETALGSGTTIFARIPLPDPAQERLS